MSDKANNQEKKLLSITFRQVGDDVRLTVDFLDSVPWRESLRIIGIGLVGMMQTAQQIARSHGISDEETTKIMQEGVGE